jgi:hypothetical protein
MAERFGKAGETYSPEVTARMTQKIASVSSVLSVSAGNRSACDVSAVLSQPLNQAAPPPTATTELRKGFERAAKELASRHKVEAFAKFPELRTYVEGSQEPHVSATIAKESAKRPPPAQARPPRATGARKAKKPAASRSLRRGKLKH